MSLLSKQDHEMTIEALEYYILSLKTYHTPDESKIAQYNTLLNWVKIKSHKTF